MKNSLLTLYFLWLCVATVVAGYALLTEFSIVWFGVIIACAPSLLNQFWCFDHGKSPSSKARFPKLSFFMFTGLGWVLLTIQNLGWPLWLVLGSVGGFLLYAYSTDEPSI